MMPDIREYSGVSDSTETFLTVSYCSQISMHLSTNGRVRSTQTLVIHQWARPSVIAKLAPDSMPDRAE